MDQSLWQETVRVDAYKESLESHYQYEEEICTKKGESIPIIKRRERGGTRIYQETVKKRIHQILKVTPNSASVLCRKEGWKEENGVELSIS